MKHINMIASKLVQNIAGLPQEFSYQNWTFYTLGPFDFPSYISIKTILPSQQLCKKIIFYILWISIGKSNTFVEKCYLISKNSRAKNAILHKNSTVLTVSPVRTRATLILYEHSIPFFMCHKFDFWCVCPLIK